LSDFEKNALIALRVGQGWKMTSKTYVLGFKNLKKTSKVQYLDF